MSRVKPTPPPPQDTPARTYGGRTGDERTAQRRAALVTAAIELVAEEGWAPLRIERACRAAGLNKRYFYESFPALDDLVVAVLDELTGAAIDATERAMADAAVDGPDAVVAAAVHALVEHLTADPRRARVLFGETAAGEAAARHRADAVNRIVRIAATHGSALHQLDDRDEPAIDLAAAVLVGGTRQAILDFLDGRLHGDVARFIADLTALWQTVSDAAGVRTRRP